MSRLIVEVKIWEKPLSANRMHYAKFKKDTVEYRRYRSQIAKVLQGDYGITPDSKLKLSLVTGYSSKLSDLDNAFKPLLDSMQCCMGFDDRQIFEIHALKTHTKKREEYILIRLEYLPKTGVTSKLRRLFPNYFDKQE